MSTISFKLRSVTSLSPPHLATDTRNSVTARKLGGVLQLLKTGRNVLFIDVDIAVVRADLVEHVMSKYVYSSGARGPDFVFQVSHEFVASSPGYFFPISDILKCYRSQ